ncbi:hypothetical protein T492DRAFT_910439 [Pavlovales sp. CCMP2436]|nr:hypothetical protein T492DRAFT_910439 [Pavlovales sp. CCMP2436]
MRPTVLAVCALWFHSCMASDTMGVSMLSYHGVRGDSTRELVTCARQLRSMAVPRLDMELFSNAAARTALQQPSSDCADAMQLWNFHSEVTELHPHIAHYAARRPVNAGFSWLLKINVFLRARFDRTLYIDSDVFILDSTYVFNLLTSALAPYL